MKQLAKLVLAMSLTTVSACGSSPQDSAGSSTPSSSTPSSETANSGTAEQQTPTTTAEDASAEPATQASSSTSEAGAPTTTALPSTAPCTDADMPKTGAAYDVTGVDADDVLNIREFPGHQTAKIGALGPNTTGLRPTGDCALVGTGIWWALDSGTNTAWINSKFLTLGS